MIVMTIWDELLSCLQEKLEEHPNPPRHTMHRTGTGEADALIGLIGRNECCEGLGIVRLLGVAPTAEPTLEAYSTAEQCDPYGWAASYELSIYRCPPTASMRLPSDEAWAIAATTEVEDATALVKAVVCCFSGLDYQWVIGETIPVAIEGSCTGVTVPVTVSIAGSDWPDCCPPSP